MCFTGFTVTYLNQTPCCGPFFRIAPSNHKKQPNSERNFQALDIRPAGATFFAKLPDGITLTSRLGQGVILTDSHEHAEHLWRSAWELGSRPCGVDTSVQFL